MRGLKEGDSFVYVRSVDLAVSLYTIGVPFFDPDRPYFYKQVGGKRTIAFNFEHQTKDEVCSTKDLVKAWPTAHQWSPGDSEQSPMTLCKRTIWDRRFLLREVHRTDLQRVSTAQLGGHLTTTDLRFASIASAVGFEKAEPAVVQLGDSQKIRIANKAPEWLGKYGIKSLTDLQCLTDQEHAFIHAQGNEWHPVAIAMACYSNTTEWLAHFRDKDSPHYKFTMPSGMCRWVKKGSSVWRTLIEQGYRPE